jgi:hypothetical protein
VKSNVLSEVNRVAQCARAFLAIVSLLLPLRSFAVTFTPLSIETLGRDAQIVVQGTVASTTCQRDAQGRIYTRIELQISDVWKGAINGSPFVIVHGGGVLGDEQQRVSGQVHYRLGEEVVAFLIRNSRGEGVTLGLLQGKFHVWKDRASGEKFAVSPFHGSEESTGSSVALESVGPRGTPGKLKLSDLKRQVLEVQP